MISKHILTIHSEIDSLIHKNNTFARVSANHLSYEFSYWLTLLGIENRMEYKMYNSNGKRNSRFDIVLFINNKPCIIIEVKNTTFRKELTELRQLKRYAEYGLPVILLENVNESKNCLRSIISYFETGNKDKYFIYP